MYVNVYIYMYIHNCMYMFMCVYNCTCIIVCIIFSYFLVLQPGKNNFDADLNDYNLQLKPQEFIIFDILDRIQQHTHIHT